MERRSEYPQSPLYLEAYLYMLDALANPHKSREDIARVLCVDEAAAAALVPNVDDEKAVAEALSAPLIGCLHAAAEDLLIPQHQALSEEDAELLMIYSLGSWPDACRNFYPSYAESAPHDANPLAHLDTVRSLWSHSLDRRRPLPGIDALIPQSLRANISSRSAHGDFPE